MTINFNVFRIGVTKDWYFKSIEKKRNELKIYLFKLNQIQNFILIFFYYYGLKTYFIRLFYNKMTLYVYVNHSLIKLLIKNNVVKTTYKSIPFLFKIVNIASLLKFKRYIKIKHINLIRNSYINNQNFKFNFSIKNLNFVNITKYLKKKLQLNTLSYVCNFFLKKYFLSLSKFFNHKTLLYLIIKYIIKPNFNKQCVKTNIRSLSFNLLKLKKFEKNNFFKLGLNNTVKYFLSLNQNCANNIAVLIQFLIEQLNNLKNLNYLLNFIENLIKCFLIKVLINGVLIKMKGNLSKNTRAIKKSLTIGRPISCVKINSQLDFHRLTIYTKKGTIGIKVFII